MSRRKTPGVRRTRRLNDGLIDPDGLRWDRLHDSELFYMTPDEARPFLVSAVRFLRTDGFGPGTTDVESKSEFTRLIKESLGHRVQAFRAADGSRRIAVTVDMSDC